MLFGHNVVARAVVEDRIVIGEEYPVVDGQQRPALIVQQHIERVRLVPLHSQAAALIEAQAANSGIRTLLFTTPSK